MEFLHVPAVKEALWLTDTKWRRWGLQGDPRDGGPRSPRAGAPRPPRTDSAADSSRARPAPAPRRRRPKERPASKRASYRLQVTYKQEFLWSRPASRPACAGTRRRQTQLVGAVRSEPPNYGFKRFPDVTREKAGDQ